MSLQFELCVILYYLCWYNAYGLYGEDCISILRNFGTKFGRQWVSLKIVTEKLGAD